MSLLKILKIAGVLSGVGLLVVVGVSLLRDGGEGFNDSLVMGLILVNALIAALLLWQSRKASP